MGTFSDAWTKGWDERNKDGAQWKPSFKIWNPSFSAANSSVTGLNASVSVASVGFTGISISTGIWSITGFTVSDSFAGSAKAINGLKNDVSSLRNDNALVSAFVDGAKSYLTTNENEVNAVACITSATTNMINAMHVET